MKIIAPLRRGYIPYWLPGGHESKLGIQKVVLHIIIHLMSKPSLVCGTQKVNFERNLATLANIMKGNGKWGC